MRTFTLELFDSIAPQDAKIGIVTNSLPMIPIILIKMYSSIG